MEDQSQDEIKVGDIGLFMNKELPARACREMVGRTGSDG
jgi:hypothetical protein